MTALTLQLTKPTKLSDDEFYEFCRANADLRIERNVNGELMVMPPTGGETGRRNASIIVQLGIWNEYIENGARLGWLIDRKDKQVEAYRPG